MIELEFVQWDRVSPYLPHVLEMIVVVAFDNRKGYEDVIDETRAPADDEQHDDCRQHLDHLQQRIHGPIEYDKKNY